MVQAGPDEALVPSADQSAFLDPFTELFVKIAGVINEVLVFEMGDQVNLPEGDMPELLVKIILKSIKRIKNSQKSSN